MDKLIFPRRRKQQARSDGSVVMRVSAEMYELILEIQDETGYSAAKITKLMAEYMNGKVGFSDFAENEEEGL